MAKAPAKTEEGDETPKKKGKLKETEKKLKKKE